ncbi:hypothetical protein [Catenuloplanes japonicus]|uniref:hypothetical protein n=1 Tax=Catenuloplanes japonicus TaxID=33876 RepID=UPI000524FC30|nr:hypothetical protein [Catenuloplanes japonicus]
MASQTWLLSDADRTIVSGRSVAVPGGRRTRRGWLVEVSPPAGNRLGRHGNLLTARVVTVLGLGLLCAVFTVADLLVPARIACLALLAAFAWTGVAYHRTNRLAALIHAGSAREPAADDVIVLTSAEERDDLDRGLRLTERIWADRAALNLGDGTGVLLGNAVRDLAAVLVQRQRLREIWNGIDRHDDAGLPQDSPAVLAARQQGERADALWAELDRDVKRHLGSLHAAAETGASLLREIALGDAARRTRVALDALGAPDSPAPSTGLGAEAYATAYRDLATRYGRDLYS